MILSKSHNRKFEVEQALLHFPWVILLLSPLYISFLLGWKPMAFSTLNLTSRHWNTRVKDKITYSLYLKAGYFSKETLGLVFSPLTSHN